MSLKDTGGKSGVRVRWEMVITCDFVGSKVIFQVLPHMARASTAVCSTLAVSAVGVGMQ